MLDVENDPFNVALREFRQRCKAYVEAHGSRDKLTHIGVTSMRADIGLLTIVYNVEMYELQTAFDGRRAHTERNGCVDYASEIRVWEGLRLIRQHTILDELASI